MVVIDWVDWLIFIFLYVFLVTQDNRTRKNIRIYIYIKMVTSLLLSFFSVNWQAVSFVNLLFFCFLVLYFYQMSLCVFLFFLFSFMNIVIEYLKILLYYIYQEKLLGDWGLPKSDINTQSKCTPSVPDSSTLNILFLFF